MTTPQIILIVCLGFILSSLAFYLFMIIYASYCIYTRTLKRPSKEEWSRNQPSAHTETHLQMDAEGMAWHEANLDKKKDVHICRDGCNLYGEYYDFGSDKCAMILSGRTESLRYGYYFAQPYAAAGMNILVVDPRAHGLSDGEYNTLGFEESKDDLAWVKYLHENHGVNAVVFHGICIGAAGGMLAITSEDCPDYVAGLVTEGMFARFAESMKNNLIERKKLMFPILQAINFWVKHYTGHSMMRGPIDVIHKMEKPLLMLHSKKDKYSTPRLAQVLYDKCPSKEKKLVWYENGGHSLLRPTDKQTYDSEISQFIKRLFKDS